MTKLYPALKDLYTDLPSYKPLILPETLPYIALLALAAAFAVTFFLTTLPKSKIPVAEFGTALVAAFLAGGGVVALFCTVGVYV